MAVLVAGRGGGRGGAAAGGASGAGLSAAERAAAGKAKSLAHRNAAKAAGKGKAGSLPPLPGAVMGEVVTRFPPEPSGFLHIGHVKACLLNHHYAKQYNGKLVIRFDDTNPSKEKAEFCDAIIEDLATLGIKGDVITHTSDHFEIITKYARKLISDGEAYMDDTEVEKMREERMEGIDSVHRYTKPKENMERFDEMLTGSTEGQRWCLRVRMAMQDDNKCLRDPVAFRTNLEPHVRTKTKYKAYPTYDLACPIVDSIEGITHAMRTTEYVHYILHIYVHIHMHVHVHVHVQLCCTTHISHGEMKRFTTRWTLRPGTHRNTATP